MVESSLEDIPMSTVRLSLLDFRYAPWGLFTDTEKPEPFIWLTQDSPVGETDSSFLTDQDLDRIYQFFVMGALSIEGLKLVEENEVELPPEPPQVPIQDSGYSPVADAQTIMDVTNLIRNENKRHEEIIQKKMEASYPEIKKLLSMNAGPLKKELKKMAKTTPSVSFFQECRKKELSGKDRKTVIAVLVEIIQSKIAVINMDGRAGTHTGQTALSEAYFDMIEEYEDEDED
jgi:hypothetical protein